jgi:hypothetical protein
MTDKEYWKLIESFMWGADFSYAKIQVLVEELEPAISAGLQDFCYTRVKDLYDRFEEYGRTKVKDDGYEHRGICYFGVSDDRLNDLTAHIVGLGEEEFNKVIQNPELARQRAKKRDYKENFMYSFLNLE